MIDLESIKIRLKVARQEDCWEDVNSDLVFKDIPDLIDEVKRQTAEIASIIAERDTEKTRANKAEAERDSLIKDFTNYAKGGTTDPSPYCANKAECIADDGWCILERCDFRPNACETRTELNNGSDYHIENLTAQLDKSQRRERDARNELCQRCGRYHEAHNGACDGCRRKETEQ